MAAEAPEMVAADTLAELTIDKPPHLQRPENMANVSREDAIAAAQKAIGMLINSANGSVNVDVIIKQAADWFSVTTASVKKVLPQADAAAHSGIEALYKDFKPILNKNGELTSSDLRSLVYTESQSRFSQLSRQYEALVRPIFTAFAESFCAALDAEGNADAKMRDLVTVENHCLQQLAPYDAALATLVGQYITDTEPQEPSDEPRELLTKVQKELLEEYSKRLDEYIAPITSQMKTILRLQDERAKEADKTLSDKLAKIKREVTKTINTEIRFYQGRYQTALKGLKMYGGRLLRVHAQTLADLSNFAYDPDALNQTTDEPKAKQARTPGRSSPGSKGKAEQPDAAVAPDTNHPQAAAVTSPVTSPVVTSPMTSPDSAAKALEDQPAPEDFASIGATITEREGGQAEGGQAEGGQADAGAAGQPTGSPPAQAMMRFNVHEHDMLFGCYVRALRAVDDALLDPVTGRRGPGWVDVGGPGEAMGRLMIKSDPNNPSAVPVVWTGLQGQPCITLGDIMKGLTVDPEQKKRKDMLGNDVMTIYLKLVDSVVLPNGRTQVKAKYMCAVIMGNGPEADFAKMSGFIAATNLMRRRAQRSQSGAPAQGQGQAT